MSDITFNLETINLHLHWEAPWIKKPLVAVIHWYLHKIWLRKWRVRLFPIPSVYYIAYSGSKSCPWDTFKILAPRLNNSFKNEKFKMLYSTNYINIKNKSNVSFWNSERSDQMEIWIYNHFSIFPLFLQSVYATCPSSISRLPFGWAPHAFFIRAFKISIPEPTTTWLTY